MINEYINNNYINNSSDILSFSNDKEFIKIFNSLDENKLIKVTSHLIHKEEYINQKKQFIFNLDNYISFIKNYIYIKPLELRYIINLTIYNKYNKCLYSDLYYYDNINYYHKEFINIFMNNYINNMHKLNLEIKKFNDLVNIINNNKRTYIYFEDLSKYTKSFYMTIIDSINS